MRIADKPDKFSALTHGAALLGAGQMAFIQQIVRLCLVDCVDSNATLQRSHSPSKQSHSPCHCICEAMITSST